MFWKKKKPLRIEIPMQSIRLTSIFFVNAKEILESAKIFDDWGEKEICKSVLEVLKKHIDNYGNEVEKKQINPEDLRFKKPEFQKDRPNTTSTLKDFYNTKSNEPNKHVLDIILEVLKEKGYYEEDLNIEIIEPVNFNNVVRRKQGFELKLKAFKK